MVLEKKHSTFVVFLDIDGVLNTKTTVKATPKGYTGIDDARVTVLAKAIEKYGGADIVLISDWKSLREDDEDYLYLLSKLNKEGLTISGKTEGIFFDRGAGILEYLHQHPEIEEFVILDDNIYDFKDYRLLWERLLRTNGIEQAEFASRSPAVEALIFMDYLKLF